MALYDIKCDKCEKKEEYLSSNIFYSWGSFIKKCDCGGNMIREIDNGPGLFKFSQDYLKPGSHSYKLL